MGFRKNGQSLLETHGSQAIAISDMKLGDWNRFRLKDGEFIELKLEVGKIL
jgi:hypothetical protein